MVKHQIMTEDLGFCNQDEVWFVEINEVFEVEDVATEALHVPGKDNEGVNRRC